jgi:HSP20 family protein
VSLVKQDAFRGFDRARTRLRLFGRGWDWEPTLPATAWNPSVDIFENDKEIVVKAELPGMSAKNIDLRLVDNVLTLRGERHFERETDEKNYHRIEREYGAFSRSFVLPTLVNADQVSAEYKDGILKVVLPKHEERKPKSINVAVT